MQITPGLAQAIQTKIDQKTKPLGALGRLEEIAYQIAMLQGSTSPQLTHPHIVVFAGDHGIAATGKVNPFPQAVTGQMVLNFLHEGAAINVFCRQNRISLKVVDAGILHPIADKDSRDKSFIEARIGPGTRNYLEQRAMSREEVQMAMNKGREIVASIHDSGCNFIGFGEMGIGNSSAAALLMNAFTGLPLADCVGKGTGANEDQLKTKMDCLEQAFAKHAASVASKDPLEILSCFGGFEMAMMTGAYLEANALRMVVVVDGFIASAALLPAFALEPYITDACIFSHCSGEKGHRKMLEYFKASPLLDLGLRLGEGTGSALAMPIVQSAVLFLNQMASFESAAVSNNQ